MECEIEWTHYEESGCFIIHKRRGVIQSIKKDEAVVKLLDGSIVTIPASVAKSALRRAKS